MKKLLSLFLLLSNGLLVSKNCSQTGCCNPKEQIRRNQRNKQLIKQEYGKVIEEGMCILGAGCCGGGKDLSATIGYTREELDAFADANFGLGCGHPVNLVELQEGDIVLDLGSGAGLDCFLAARKVGPTGFVIGIDITQAMVDKAQANAQKYQFSNVGFYVGDIENLPIPDNVIDVVMSNCVINLADKEKVFKEIYRVLKPDGKIVISDIILTGPLTIGQKNNKKLLIACVSGAMQKNEYLALLAQVGFKITLLDEDREINKKWFGDENNLPISSIKFVAQKK
ncbi:MAG: arsenite methyltransferase [Candidatus Babeliaceae bacterium]